jgi:hypothetical protein
MATHAQQGKRQEVINKHFHFAGVGFRGMMTTNFF